LSHCPIVLYFYDLFLAWICASEKTTATMLEMGYPLIFTLILTLHTPSLSLPFHRRAELSSTYPVCLVISICPVCFVIGYSCIVIFFPCIYVCLFRLALALALAFLALALALVFAFAFALTVALWLRLRLRLGLQLSLR
jgi:hypothetical protein